MSPLFDELEEQLRSAARVRAGREDRPPAPRRGRAWLHAGLGAVPVLAAVLVALAVVGGALVLLGHRGHQSPMPSTTPPAGGGIGAIIAKTPRRQLERELAYISAATRATLRSRACHVDTPSGVSLIHGSPDAALTSTLGVLTRPATPADKLSPATLSGTPDVYAGHVRRALSADGVSYFIVPARFDRSSVPSNRCFDLQLAALRAYLPHIQPSLRQLAVMLQAGLIAHARSLVARAPRDTICLTTVSRNSGSSECGISAAQIKAGIRPSNSQGTFSGVVPDGVASVTLSFAASSGHPARTVTTPVVNNVYAVHVPGVSGAAQVQPTLIWRSSQGTVLKRMSPPRPETVTADCRRHPVACLDLQISSTAFGSSASSSSSSSSTVAASAPKRAK